MSTSQPSPQTSPKENFARDLTGYYRRTGMIDEPTAQRLYDETLAFLSDKTLVSVTPEMVHRVVNMAGYALPEMEVFAIVQRLTEEADAGRLITEQILSMAVKRGRTLTPEEEFQVGDGKIISDVDEAPVGEPTTEADRLPELPLEELEELQP